MIGPEHGYPAALQPLDASRVSPRRDHHHSRDIRGVPDQTQLRTQVGSPIEDHPPRRDSGFDRSPDGEGRIIQPGRSPTDNDGVKTGPEPLDVVAGFRTRDPTGAAVAISDPTIERGGELERHVR